MTVDLEKLRAARHHYEIKNSVTFLERHKDWSEHFLTVYEAAMSLLPPEPKDWVILCNTTETGVRLFGRDHQMEPKTFTEQEVALKVNQLRADFPHNAYTVMKVPKP